MNHAQTMLYVVLPQAIRNIMPSVGNEFVVNIKDTSVLNVISVTELYFQANPRLGRTPCSSRPSRSALRYTSF